MKLKRTLAVLMAAAMTLSLAACGSSQNAEKDETNDAEKTYNIGICQVMEQPKVSRMPAMSFSAKEMLRLISRMHRESSLHAVLSRITL